MENKITKKTKMTAVLDVLDWAMDNGYEFSDSCSFDALHAFIEDEITLIDNKAEAARKRAAANKVTGDALRDKIESFLTSEPQTVRAITSAIGDEEITEAMVVPRLKQLLEMGKITKETTKVNGAEGARSRILVTYRLVD